jgi:hypothetical protein
MSSSVVATVPPVDNTEPFPSLVNTAPLSSKSPRREDTEPSDPNRSRDQSITSSLQGRLRSASKTFQESSPPVGFCIATGQAATNIPSLTAIRRGSFGGDGWSGEGQVREKARRASLSRRGSGQDLPRRRSSALPESPLEHSGQDVIRESVSEGTEPQHLSAILSGKPIVTEPSSSMSNTTQMEPTREQSKGTDQRSSSETNQTPKNETEFRTTPFDNGYHFPPKHTWTESTAIGLKAAWKFVITPIGFLVTIYGLNIVAWGGMLFLLLCNASPAMCRPTCNDINSPRRIWIETDSQILNALFCVTGFGTIPWRFRDLYYLMQYRIQKKEIGLRRLAGINRGWFRLAGSQDLPAQFGPTEAEAAAGNSSFSESKVAFPLNKTPEAPLTGIRAPPTALWKLDFVIWTMVWNTFLQAVLSGFMWGMNRYDRPSWSTGLFVALACIVAACGGIMSFIEGKHVKAIEGVPVSEEDQERLRRDREQGITHWNNIKGEKPKEKKAKEPQGTSIQFTKPTQAEDVQVELGALREGAGQIIR